MYAEGSAPTHVYIVRSGEFVLRKMFAREHGDPLENPLAKVSRLFAPPAQRKKMELKIFAHDDILGLDEIHAAAHVYELACVSIEGELLAIEKSLYETRIEANFRSKRFVASLANAKHAENERRVHDVGQHFKSVSQLLVGQQRATSTALNTSIEEVVVEPTSPALAMHVRIKKERREYTDVPAVEQFRLFPAAKRGPKPQHSPSHGSYGSNKMIRSERAIVIDTDSPLL